jgi:hypothetical protein
MRRDMYSALGHPPPAEFGEWWQHEHEWPSPDHEKTVPRVSGFGGKAQIRSRVLVAQAFSVGCLSLTSNRALCARLPIPQNHSGVKSSDVSLEGYEIGSTLWTTERPTQGE